MNKGYSGLGDNDNYVSCGVMQHSDEGEFNALNRHKSGGHGENAIKYMDSNGIKYEITRIHENGVREGNIPNSKQTFSRTGSNHTWFPSDWSGRDIRRAGEYVGSKFEYHVDGVQYSAYYKGVNVSVIYRNGQISTVFPNKDQGD